MQLLSILGRLKAHHVIDFIKNLAQNLWQIEDGLVSHFSSKKIVNGHFPSYRQSYLNHCNDGEYQTRPICPNKMKTLSGKTKSFDSSFYPCSTKEWCIFCEEIRNAVSVNKFKTIILSFIRPKENSVFVIHGTKGMKLLMRLRLNFSRLN